MASPPKLAGRGKVRTPGGVIRQDWIIKPGVRKLVAAGKGAGQNLMVMIRQAARLNARGVQFIVTPHSEVTNLAPVWTMVPSQSLTVGQDLDLNLLGYVTDPEGQPLTITANGTLPAWMTLTNGRLSGRPTASDVGSLSISFVADDGYSSGAIIPPVGAASLVGRIPSVGVGVPSSFGATLTLTNGAVSKPWTFGHAFKQGDVPSGAYITSVGPTQFQADVRNRWSDGSVKFAVLSGIGGAAAALSATATPPASGSVTFVDPQASVTFTGEVTGTYACPTSDSVGTWSKSTAHLVRKISGPVMTERHYYVPTTDAHVAVWFYVRSYVGGATEVETVVENGWTMIAAPAQKTYTVTVSVGGSTRYTGSVSHYHHARWSRSDWVGVDPAITPVHNGAYLRSTKLVPNYGYYSPTSAAWTDPGAPSTWGTPLNSENPTPLAVGNLSPSMGDYGYHESIGLMPRLDALYITSQNVIAYRSMVGNARCRGRYSIHQRDETTGRPFKLSAPLGNAANSAYLGFEPNNTEQKSSNKYGCYSPASATYQMPAPSGAYNLWATSHAHAPPYLAYLVTGRWQFMEECQFQVNFVWLLFPNDGNLVRRDGAKGIMGCQIGTMSGQRWAAWHWRTVGMAACVTPDAETGLDGGLKAEYEYVLSSNVAYDKATYTDTGTWANGLHSKLDGSDPGSGEYSRIFMTDFWVATTGFVSDLGVIPVASVTDYVAVRDWFYGFIVGRFGTSGAPTSACWKDAGNNYNIHISSTDNMGNPTTYYPTWGACYQANSLGLTCSATGDPTGSSSDPNGTIVSGYVANALPGLIYAVDHGISGASAAYALLQQSSVFQGCQSGSVQYGGFSNNPTWGVVPR